MSAPRLRRTSPRFVGACAACLALTALVACAELELGAEAAKGLARTAEPAAPQIAQANLKPRPQDAVSRYLKPAPQIFEATGLAVWDGKRTLQGVWVAHPLASSARRVRIFNTTNGRAVDGALFKRDSALSGASVLISSEAAELLGMSADDPAELRIVAVTPVRKTEPATTQSAVPEATTPAQTGATATSAPAVDADAPSTRDQTAEQPAEQPAGQPGSPEIWKTTRAEPQETLATTVQPTPVPTVIVPRRKPKLPTETPETRTATAPAAAVSPSTPASPPTAAKPAVATPSTLKRPFVQAGVFGVAGNAKALVEKLADRGYPAVARTITSGGRTLTRVLAGPFATIPDRDAAQNAIRKMGMRDAAPVKR